MCPHLNPLPQGEEKSEAESRAEGKSQAAHFFFLSSPNEERIEVRSRLRALVTIVRRNLSLPALPGRLLSHE